MACSAGRSVSAADTSLMTYPSAGHDHIADSFVLCFADWEDGDDDAADQQPAAASDEVASRTPSAAQPAGQDAVNVFVQVCCHLFCCGT